jgi:hypothetical protein
VFDRSVDFPLDVKDERVNLDLDPERSREEEPAPGGGGKLGGAGSLRFRFEKGDMTVMALAGLAYSGARFGGLGILVCKAGGVRFGGLMTPGLRAGVFTERERCWAML